MEEFGNIIRNLRVEKGVPLRTVAAYLEIDQAILSKIERGQRKASKSVVVKLARYYKTNQDKLMIQYLGDKIASEIANEPLAAEALKVAEDQVLYLRTPNLSLPSITKAVVDEFEMYKSVIKVYVFGSFARNEASYKSDVDLMIDVPSKEGFSLFDLFEIQHNLEKRFKRKVDIVLKGALKPFAQATAEKDMKLLYDRSAKK